MNEFLFFMTFYGLSAAIITIVITIMMMEYKEQNIALIFWITIFFVYVLPSLTDPFRKNFYLWGAYNISIYNINDILIYAHIYVLVFCSTYLLARLCTRGVFFNKGEARIFLWKDIIDFPEQFKYSRQTHIFTSLLAIVAIVSLIISSYAIYSKLGWSGLSDSGYNLYRLTADSKYTQLGAHLTHIAAAGLFVAWLTRRWGVFCIILLFIMGNFFLRFNRSIFITLGIPFLTYAVFKNNNFKGALKIIFMIVIGYLGIHFLQAFRFFGSAYDALIALQNGELFEKVKHLLTRTGGESDLRYFYYFLIDHDRSAFNLFWGQGYIRIALLPIPSKIISMIKPEDVDTVLYYFLHPGYHVKGGSSHTLIFGDSYANFGWVGMFCGSIWAIFASISNRILAWLPMGVRIHMIGIFGSAAVMIARGTIYNSCSRVFWQLLISLLIYYFGVLLYDMLKTSTMPAHGNQIRC